jgi:hypothetical protein
LCCAATNDSNGSQDLCKCLTCWFDAAWCRARRKIEEAKARERYERYVKERAERHEREQKERAEAKRKALEAEERRKKAEEDYNRRKVRDKPEFIRVHNVACSPAACHAAAVPYQQAQGPNALLPAGVLRGVLPRRKCAAMLFYYLTYCSARKYQLYLRTWHTLECAMCQVVLSCRGAAAVQ